MGLSTEDVELWAKHNNFTIVADEWWEAAQDIICKYQRIEQILKEPCIIPEGCYPMLKKIKRVVEDGENDN